MKSERVQGCPKGLWYKQHKHISRSAQQQGKPSRDLVDFFSAQVQPERLHTSTAMSTPTVPIRVPSLTCLHRLGSNPPKSKYHPFNSFTAPTPPPSPFVPTWPFPVPNVAPSRFTPSHALPHPLPSPPTRAFLGACHPTKGKKKLSAAPFSPFTASAPLPAYSRPPGHSPRPPVTAAIRPLRDHAPTRRDLFVRLFV